MSWRRRTLFSLILLACLGLGYLQGYRPDWYSKWFPNEEILLVVQDRILLPTPLEEHLKLSNSLPFKVSAEFDSGSVDVYLGLYRQELNAITDPVLLGPEFQQLLDADFQIQDLVEKNALPLFWRVAEGRLEIVSLTITKAGAEKGSSKLVKSLLKMSTQEQWLGQIPYGTSLHQLEASELAPDKKASALRRLELSSLSLKTQM